MKTFTLLLLAALVILMLHPLIENAGNPGSLIQLATSSTDPRSMPIGHSSWKTGRVGGTQGRPYWQDIGVRPVMQRGVFFNNPRMYR